MCRPSKRCRPASTGHGNPTRRAASAATAGPAEQTPANMIFSPAIPDGRGSAPVRAATLPGRLREWAEWPLPASSSGRGGGLTRPGRGGVAEGRRTSPAALVPALHDRSVQFALAAR